MDDTFLHALIEALPQPVVLIAPDARVLAANGAAQTMFGAAILGRHHALTMRQPALLSAIEAALHGKPVEFRYSVTRNQREDVYSVTVNPVPFQGAHLALCSFVDMTAAEQTALIHRDFVANVSHELRTPLTALMGFIETLKGPAKSDEPARLRFLEIMEREAGRMNRLIRDLLSLSRVEAQERQRPAGACDIVKIAGSVVAMLTPLATDAKVSLRLVVGTDPVLIRGDQDQLVQVLQNLIENAVKYGAAAGEVTIKIAQMQDPVLRVPAISVTIADQGEGIDPLHLPRLTERFYRIDAHRSRAQGGTGLGLAIVKHIVQRHRGRLVIDSAPGNGSTFSVILPIA